MGSCVPASLVMAGLQPASWPVRGAVGGRVPATLGGGCLADTHMQSCTALSVHLTVLSGKVRHTCQCRAAPLSHGSRVCASQSSTPAWA